MWSISLLTNIVGIVLHIKAYLELGQPLDHGKMKSHGTYCYGLNGTFIKSLLCVGWPF